VHKRFTWVGSVVQPLNSVGGGLILGGAAKDLLRRLLAVYQGPATDPLVQLVAHSPICWFSHLVAAG
jgi:hypothetical protein